MDIKYGRKDCNHNWFALRRKGLIKEDLEYNIICTNCGAFSKIEQVSNIKIIEQVCIFPAYSPNYRCDWVNPYVSNYINEENYTCGDCKHYDVILCYKTYKSKQKLDSACDNFDKKV